jgi:hypothetical protein
VGDASIPKGGRGRPLGSAQLYVLRMVNPEWITRTPDARSVRVLRSLEARGMVYENRGRWYISSAGKEMLAALEQDGQHLA